MQFVGTHVAGQPLGVGHPGLADEHPGPPVAAAVVLDDRAPALVDLVHAFLVPVVGLGPLAEEGDAVGRRRRVVRQQVVLDQAVGDVDAEAVDAAVEPEPDGGVVVVADAGVPPVPVGLFRREQVQVPLAVGDPGPRRPAEDRHPVVGWLVAVRAASVAEDVQVPFWCVGAGGQRGAEGRVGVAGVVRDEVDEHLQPVPVRFGEQRVEGGQVAEERVDGTVVGDVIAVVGHGGTVERSDPDPVHAEVAQVGQAGGDAGEVTDPVGAGVGEAADVDLVQHCVEPPVSHGLIQSRGICRCPASLDERRRTSSDPSGDREDGFRTRNIE